MYHLSGGLDTLNLMSARESHLYESGFTGILDAGSVASFICPTLIISFFALSES